MNSCLEICGLTVTDLNSIEEMQKTEKPSMH